MPEPVVIGTTLGIVLFCWGGPIMWRLQDAVECLAAVIGAVGYFFGHTHQINRRLITLAGKVERAQARAARAEARLAKLKEERDRRG